MTIPTLLSFILGATVDVALLAYGARRLLAERRFSLSRTIVAGLAGQALTSAIFTAMASGWHLGAHGPSPAYGVVLGFAALSWACGLLRQIVVDGIFHADPHPGNILLLDDGRLGLIDFGAVGRLDSGLRAVLQRLMLAIDRRDPVAMTDALLEVTARPDDLDEQALERSVGALLVRHLASWRAPDATMFADLFRLVTRHELAVPPEFVATFRALSTLEGGLTLLAPGFDIVAEAERFGQTQLAERLHPVSLKDAAADEITALLPMLRRLPRRMDRIAAAVEGGRLNVNVRALADERDRKVITGWI